MTEQARYAGSGESRGDLMTAVKREQFDAARDLPRYLPQGTEVEMFLRAHRRRLPVLIKGPTGCGKTRFVEHMAARLGRPLYTVACHDDLSATDLIGRHLIDGSGTYWSDGPLTRAVREGAIIYLDEVVEARKDTTVVLHPLSDDRRMLPIERLGQTLKAPADFMLVVSYNPGYQNLLKGMKPSTRQRFVSLRFGFPEPMLEGQIVAGEAGADEATAERLVQLATALRRLKDYDIEESVSTRLLVYCAGLITDGASPREACLSTLVEPLTDDEETVAALMELVDAAYPHTDHS
jgi:nitric oxide reductase NorQ protein